jgi:uncharacterized protein (TIGR02246 family)
MTKDEQAIRQMVEEWMAASKRRDTETVLKMITDDVVFLTAGREPFGKKEFETMNRQMSQVKVEGKSEIQEIQVLGDWAWMRNKLRIQITPPGKPMMVKSGYTLTVLRKNGEGKWQIARDANLVG